MSAVPPLVRITHWHRHGEDILLLAVPSVGLGARLIEALDYDNTDPGEIDDKGNEVLPADFQRAQSLIGCLFGADLELRDDEGISADWGEVRSVSELFLGGILEVADSVYAKAALKLDKLPDPDRDEGGVV